MMTPTDAFARTRDALFRIPIEPKDDQDWWWGTGFFVSADGYALTAFHNLRTGVAAARCGEVDGLDGNGRVLRFDLVPIDGDAAWDVALLKLRDGEAGAYLTIATLPEGLSDEDRIRFWAARPVIICGFPLNTRGQDEEVIAGHVRGDAPLGIEDVKDQGGIAGQIEQLRILPDYRRQFAGISGGPIVELGSGLVVGVEGAWDPQRMSLLGTELRRGSLAWPTDLRRAFETLDHTSASLRDRANGLVGIVRQPWDPERMPPGALLRPDCAASVPFHGREEEFGDLEDWCVAHRTLGIRLYTGAGGIGKTRLFLELCDRLRGRGWRAGFLLAEAAHASADLWAALIGQASPTLLVIDYAEHRRGEIAALLRALVRARDGHVRIVALARGDGDWWELLKSEGHGVGDLLAGPSTRVHELRPLAMGAAQRQASYLMAARTFAGALGVPMSQAVPPDLSADHFERVLLLHMSALAAVEGVPVAGDQGILDYVLRRERRFWAKQLVARGLPLVLDHAVAEAMAVITLGGGANDGAHARLILRQLPLLKDQTELIRREIAELLHSAYPGTAFIEPMMPDLLGEHLIQIEFGKDATGVLYSLVFDGLPPADRLPS